MKKLALAAGALALAAAPVVAQNLPVTAPATEEASELEGAPAYIAAIAGAAAVVILIILIDDDDDDDEPVSP